jgi:hypothetical protein
VNSHLVTNRDMIDADVVLDICLKFLAGRPWASDGFGAPGAAAQAAAPAPALGSGTGGS